MKLQTGLILFVFCSITAKSQTYRQLDTSLARKITVSGFCLCQTTLENLEKLDSGFRIIQVEEMDLPSNCYGQDGRFEGGKGYYSDKYPGLVFQKDPTTEEISKIRLTREFKGNLPGGPQIDLSNLILSEVFKIYPFLKDKWGSRGCSNYWNIGNDTLSFYVKIDSTKKPQYPVDEDYYNEKQIDAIDLKVSCYKLFEPPLKYKQLLSDPIYFIDSVNVTRIELQNLNAKDVAEIVVYKDTNAIKLVGDQGRFGAVYIETKTFAKNKYWNFFKSKSEIYFKIVPTPESDSAIAYILNGKVLGTNFEGDLSNINDQSFVYLKVIDKDKLKKEYKVTGKSFGVLISTKK
jgi:hypothetical protein